MIPENQNYLTTNSEVGFFLMKFGLIRFPKLVLDHIIHHRKIYNNPEYACYQSHFGTVIQRFLIVIAAIPTMCFMIVVGAIFLIAGAVESAYNYFLHRNQNLQQVPPVPPTSPESVAV